MPEISLREYEIEIDQLIEEARYLEALAHVRHILSHYPRHIGAYYLMGKMLLEADQPDLAVDMFRRALNADPEHLKSRIGLGLAHEQRDDLSAAIWNLERAFELAPANADIADELRRIYGRRDGREPDHIPISRAGLSRLYMRGNLSSRAVDELRNLLTVEPKRPDLLGALAEAYWRDGQIVQAAETCQRILDDMPYHRKANLLLGTLWLNSGQEEGQTYLNRSQEVDVDNALAVDLLGTASPLKQREVFMDRLVYDLNGIDVDQQAQWFKRLEAASVSVGISEAVPDMSESDVRLVDITAGLESQIEIPDWLRELGSLEDGTEPEGGLSWMSDMTLGEELAGRDTAVETVEPPAVEIEASEVVISGAVESADAVVALESTEGPADWLSEFVSEELDETAEEIPDWLQGITPTPKAAVQEELPVEALIESADQIAPDDDDFTQVVSEDEVEETPDWLQEIVPPSIEETEEEPEEDVMTGVLAGAVTDVVAEVTEISITTDYGDEEEPEAEDAEVLVPTEDFIEQPLSESTLEVDSEEAVVAEYTAEGDEESANLDWLDEIVTGIDAEEISQPETISQHEDVSEDTPDWLQAMAPSTEEVSTGALSDAGDGESAELDWPEKITADLEPEESEVPLEESKDVPDWLQALAPTDAEAVVMEPAVEEEDSTELDWLGKITADLEPAEGEVPLAVSDDMPDWLQALAPTGEQATVMGPAGEEEESTELDWLEEISADLEPAESEVPLEESADVPDWLQTLAPAGAQATVIAPVGGEEESTEFDWLESIAAEADTDETQRTQPLTSPADDIAPEDVWVEEVEEAEGSLDWLEQISAEAPTTAEIIPDWISQLQPISTESDDFILSEEEIPDLLAGLDESADDATVKLAADQIQLGETESMSTLESDDIGYELDFDIVPEQEPDMQKEGDFFGWQAFGDDITKAEPVLPMDADITETPVGEMESLESMQPTEEPAGGLFGWDAFGETITEATPAAPRVGGDVLSGDDALAWLESLTAGKEEELLAQTEIESEARMAEILGRKTQPVQVEEGADVSVLEELVEEVPAAEISEPEPEPEVMLLEEPSAEVEEPEPVAEVEGDVLSGDDALAWLESLTVGKEEELRAQTEIESEARMAEILGRKTTPVQVEEGADVSVLEELVEEVPAAEISEPEPEPEVMLLEEPSAEVEEPEPVVEAEGDLLPGDDALAWLESLTVGKEEELRAQTEIDSEARMAEIPAVEIDEPEPAPEVMLLEEPSAEVEQPELEAEVPAAIVSEPEVIAVEEPVAEAEVRELEAEAPAAIEPEVMAVEEPVAEAEKPELEEEAKAVDELEPESVPTTGEAAVSTEQLLEEMRSYLKRKRSDHDTRLRFSRALWSAGEIKEAMKNYGTLIKSGAKMGEIYEDLQSYLQTHPKDSDVLRTLGDAYMKDGDLERALEIYNEAMNTL